MKHEWPSINAMSGCLGKEYCAACSMVLVSEVSIFSSNKQHDSAQTAASNAGARLALTTLYWSGSLPCCVQQAGQLRLRRLKQLRGWFSCMFAGSSCGAIPKYSCSDLHQTVFAPRCDRSPRFQRDVTFLLLSLTVLHPLQRGRRFGRNAEINIE